MSGHLRGSVTSCAAIAAIGLCGCGSGISDALLQSVNAAGRAAIDVFLTDLANDLAADRESLSDSSDDVDDGGNTLDDDESEDSDETSPPADGGDEGDGAGPPAETGDEADSVVGQAFFTANNCATCHADDASGDFGPDLIGLESARLFDILSGAEAHTGETVAGITQQDAADLAAWLAAP